MHRSSSSHCELYTTTAPSLNAYSPSECFPISVLNIAPRRMPVHRDHSPGLQLLLSVDVHSGICTWYLTHRTYRMRYRCSIGVSTCTYRSSPSYRWYIHMAWGIGSYILLAGGIDHCAHGMDCICCARMAATRAMGRSTHLRSGGLRRHTNKLEVKSDLGTLPKLRVYILYCTGGCMNKYTYRYVRRCLNCSSLVATDRYVSGRLARARIALPAQQYIQGGSIERYIWCIPLILVSTTWYFSR